MNLANPMAAAQTETVLSAKNLVMKFGGITATNNVTLDLKKGARHALIGPNGAGKTTLINLLTGVLQPTSGQIILEGQDISQLAPHQRVRLGMVRTFQAVVSEAGKAVSKVYDKSSMGVTQRVAVSASRRTALISSACHRPRVPKTLKVA